MRSVQVAPLSSEVNTVPHPMAMARPVLASNATDTCHAEESESRSVQVAPLSSEVRTVPSSPTAMARPVLASNATERSNAKEPEVRSVQVAPLASEVSTAPRSPTAIARLPPGEAATDLRAGRDGGDSEAHPSGGVSSRHSTLSASDLQVAPALTLSSNAPLSPTTRMVRPSSMTAKSFRPAVMVCRRANALLSIGVIHHWRALTRSCRPGRGAPIQLRSAAPCSGSATSAPTLAAISPAAISPEPISKRPGSASRVSFIGGGPIEGSTS